MAKISSQTSKGARNCPTLSYFAIWNRTIEVRRESGKRETIADGREGEGAEDEGEGGEGGEDLEGGIGDGEEGDGDGDGDGDDAVLFFVSKDGNLSRESKARKVGLAQGMVDFVKMLGNPSTPIHSVHGSNTRLVFLEPEPGWIMCASLDLPRYPKSKLPTSSSSQSIPPSTSSKPSNNPQPPTTTTDSSDTQEWIYTSEGIHDQALLSGLQRGWEEFRLLHGPFSSLFTSPTLNPTPTPIPTIIPFPSISRSELRSAKRRLEGFFSIWVWRWQVEKCVGGLIDVAKVAGGVGVVDEILGKDHGGRAGKGGTTGVAGHEGFVNVLGALPQSHLPDPLEPYFSDPETSSSPSPPSSRLARLHRTHQRLLKSDPPVLPIVLFQDKVLHLPSTSSYNPASYLPSPSSSFRRSIEEGEGEDTNADESRHQDPDREADADADESSVSTVDTIAGHITALQSTTVGEIAHRSKTTGSRSPSPSRKSRSDSSTKRDVFERPKITSDDILSLTRYLLTLIQPSDSFAPSSPSPSNSSTTAAFSIPNPAVESLKSTDPTASSSSSSSGKRQTSMSSLSSRSSLASFATSVEPSHSSRPTSIASSLRSVSSVDTLRPSGSSKQPFPPHPPNPSSEVGSHKKTSSTSSTSSKWGSLPSYLGMGGLSWGSVGRNVSWSGLVGAGSGEGGEERKFEGEVKKEEGEVGPETSDSGKVGDTNGGKDVESRDSETKEEREPGGDEGATETDAPVGKEEGVDSEGSPRTDDPDPDLDKTPTLGSSGQVSEVEPDHESANAEIPESTHATTTPPPSEPEQDQEPGESSHLDAPVAPSIPLPSPIRLEAEFDRDRLAEAMLDNQEDDPVPVAEGSGSGEGGSDVEVSIEDLVPRFQRLKVFVGSEGVFERRRWVEGSMEGSMVTMATDIVGFSTVGRAEVIWFQDGPLTAAFIWSEDEHALSDHKEALRKTMIRQSHRLFTDLRDVMAESDVDMIEPTGDHRHLIHRNAVRSASSDRDPPVYLARSSTHSHWPTKDGSWTPKKASKEADVVAALLDCRDAFTREPNVQEMFVRTGTSQWVVAKRSAVTGIDAYLALPKTFGKQGSLFDAENELRRLSRLYPNCGI